MKNREDLEENKQINKWEKIYYKFIKKIWIVAPIRTPHTHTLQMIYMLSNFKDKRYVIHKILEEYTKNFETDRKFIINKEWFCEIVEYNERPSDWSSCDKIYKKTKI